MSEREIAQRVYNEMQRNANPSAFDAMGAFNQYYNQGKTNSLAVPLDAARAIDPTARPEFAAALANQQQYQKQQAKQPGFWGKIFGAMEKAYNLSSQAVTFAMTAGLPSSPLRQGGNIVQNLGETWKQAGQISPGQAFVTEFLGQPLSLLGSVNPGVDKFLNDHMKFASSDFNLFNKNQREQAFREQTFGRFSSLTTDAIARFTIDPTILAGKAVKGLRAAKYAIGGVEDLKAALTGAEVGKKAERTKATFQNFLDKTDGMNTSELFRVKAIRESGNPATLADVLADANKIEDVTARHQAKADIIQWAMGDAGAAKNLLESNKDIAAKIANLEDEITWAKTFGASEDKVTKQLAMDLVNQGDNLEKNQALVDTLKAQLDKNYKMLDIAGTLTPDAIPQFGALTAARNLITLDTSSIVGSKINDLRNGAAGPVVRFATGFAYKRPKGWIDFTDNQSVQTLDNMLTRVRSFSDKQKEVYTQKLDKLKNDLQFTEDAAEKKSIKGQITQIEKNMKDAEFSVEKRNALFDKYTSAVDADARAAAYQDIEQEVFNTVARQFGFDNAEDVNAAFRKFSTARQSAYNMIRERAYTGATERLPSGQMAPLGATVTPIEGSEGLLHVIPKPLNETQLVRQLPTLDVDQMYNTLQRYTRSQRGAPYEFITKNQNRLTNMADSIDGLLKFEVLARLGYPIRNVTEGYMRIMSTIGPMSIMNRVAYGLGAAKRNILNSKFAEGSLEDAFKWSNGVKLEVKKQELEAMLSTADNPDEILKEIKDLDAMISGKTKVIDKYGMGLNEIRIGDKVITIEDALGATPEKARYIRDKFIANASQIVDNHFTDANAKLRNAFETNGDWVIVNGADPDWAVSYQRVINRQVRGSKFTSILLQDKPRDVVMAEAKQFLTGTQDGRRIMRNLALGRDVDSIIEANMQNVESLFPEFAGGLKKIASERQITPEDIKKYFSNVADRPDVNAAQVSNANGTSAMARNWAKFQESFYNMVGEAPERALVRNPIFVDLYRKRMDALVKNAIDTYPGDEIPAEFLRKLENNSRQWARSEMRRLLYDTSERVDAASTMRYMFPFFGAFADVVEKWGKIVLNDPSIIRSLNTVYESPDRSGMVEEKDGIKYINIPGDWAKRLGFGDRPRAIPKPSLNLIFQGGAWWNPGAGWFVQFPMSMLVKRNPNLEKNFLTKEVLPYGPTGTGWTDLAVQSAAARKALSLFDVNDPQRQNLTVLVAAEENAKYDAGIRDDKPSAKEINDKVIKILALDVASRLVLPFASNTRSPYQLFLDEFHRLRQQDPATAAEKFYNLYGNDFYIFTTSLSKNNTGIAATVEADKRSQQLSDLIAKKPEFGWFVVGDANAGQFSPAVYQKQREMAVAPGSTTKFRESQDPYEAIQQTNVEKGWILYNKGINLIEAQRIARGLKSLNSKGAEDLLAAKQKFVSELESENRDWADNRGKIDMNRVVTFLRFASDVINDPRVKQRPDMQSMATYLQGREAVRNILASRKSKSLDSKDNADLKDAWDQFTGDLIDEDAGGAFSKIYTRYLEKDDLTKGL